MKSTSQFDSSSFFRRAIFAATLIGVFLLYTVFSFNGLTHKTGIDQAQVAREVARGNGLTSQFVRPLSIQQLIENGKPVNLEHMPESYHSPLNILVYAGALKMVGGDKSENYEMHVNDKFYALDQVIAITCASFFLIAIGINYLLVSRIFDQKIASVVAIIMMLSEYMWQVTQSGLPQMLMLTLFSTAMYLAWRAVEAQEAEKKPLIPALLSGFFFGLLVLTHWMTLWIFIGYFIFATFYFRPRGIIAIGLAVTMALFITGPVIYYFNQTGEPLGSALHAIHNNDSVMRNLSTPGPVIKGILVTTAQTTLMQFSNVHNYLGGLILAPAFFIALLHPFKRNSIAIFRWNILTMWVFACLGMAVYGLSDNAVDPNQLHMLFAPLMCAYGIAMMSIVWSRCNLSNQNSPFLSNLHLVIITLVVAAPMILFLKKLADDNSNKRSVEGVHALSLNKSLQSLTQKSDIIISDQPWAVAWYADRRSIWTPQSIDQLEQLEAIAPEDNKIAGLHFSSSSYRNDTISEAYAKGRDLTPLAYSAWVKSFTGVTSPFRSNSSIDPLINPKSGRYKHSALLTSWPEPSIYYAKSIHTSN